MASLLAHRPGDSLALVTQVRFDRIWSFTANDRGDLIVVTNRNETKTLIRWRIGAKPVQQKPPSGTFLFGTDGNGDPSFEPEWELISVDSSGRRHFPPAPGTGIIRLQEGWSVVSTPTQLIFDEPNKDWMPFDPMEHRDFELAGVRAATISPDRTVALGEMWGRDYPVYVFRLTGASAPYRLKITYPSDTMGHIVALELLSPETAIALVALRNDLQPEPLGDVVGNRIEYAICRLAIPSGQMTQVGTVICWQLRWPTLARMGLHGEFAVWAYPNTIRLYRLAL